MLFRCHWCFITYLCSISFIFSIQLQNSQLHNILKQLIAHKQNPSLSCLLFKTLVFHSRNHLRAGPSQPRSRSPGASGRNPPRLRRATKHTQHWPRRLPEPVQQRCGKNGAGSREPVLGCFTQHSKHPTPTPAVEPNPRDVRGGLTA